MADDRILTPVEGSLVVDEHGKSFDMEPVKVEDVKEEFLAGYNVAEDGGFYAVFTKAFFQGKNFVFESRVKDFMAILWDVRDGKIKPTR